MPITKSAKKALRQSERRRIRNLKVKNLMKDKIKELRRLLSEKKIEETKSLLPSVYKTLDKATKSGVIKKNTASRKKSRLIKALNKIIRQGSP